MTELTSKPDSTGGKKKYLFDFDNIFFLETQVFSY
jgi:hypothetical protein